MTKVFLSGSRKISRLNEQIRERVQNIARQEFEIVVGDANGADKALQTYLYTISYPHVTVYCSGNSCRNNVGSWPTRNITVSPTATGRDFYTQKDKRMAEDADYGFVLWDGESSGALENIIELLKRNKNSLVYLSPQKKFYSIASVSQLRAMLAACRSYAVDRINSKIGLRRALETLAKSSQTELGF